MHGKLIYWKWFVSKPIVSTECAETWVSKDEGIEKSKQINRKHSNTGRKCRKLRKFRTCHVNSGIYINL